MSLSSKLPTVDEIKAFIDAELAIVNPSLYELNHDIWSHPELAFEEHHAHDSICDFLEEQGFEVTRHAYGIPTSFEARSGSGGRLVNFNAEYDALPDIGHACGHNLIATASIAAFLAMSKIFKKYGIPGRTQLLGTPAEESGGGKIKLVDAGAFAGVHVSLMAHAGPLGFFSGIAASGFGAVPMNAREEITCEFTGRNAHAGGNPWDGLNALDALVVSYNNVSVLRQQLRAEERIHCAFLETPKVANVIPASTKSSWIVRSPSLQGLKDLVARVRKCLEAGALATGCDVNLAQDGLYADMKIIDALCERYQVNIAKYGRKVLPRLPMVLSGSSDIGNVSYVVPTMHTAFGIITPDGCIPHNASFTAAAGTKDAHDESVLVGKSLALVAWDAITDDEFYNVILTQWKATVAV